MSILSDYEITDLSNLGMITRFVPEQVREAYLTETSNTKRISYGLSSYGYDMRLSPEEFFIYDVSVGGVVDPKRFDPTHLRQIELHHNDNLDESYYILPPKTYGLGVTLERMVMPDYITAIALGKSTYARCGLLINMTPIEAGWRGHITIELYNSSDSPLRIYAYEGIIQLLFFRGAKCKTTYADRAGKYQNQTHNVTMPR